jgi:hypothetical protein
MANVGALTRIVQGLLIHSDWLGDYAVDPSRMGPVSRPTLPMAERLDHILAKDGSALEALRSPQNRSVGTCRDFALMLCAFLRVKGAPARVRCGFAAYFNADWEDHWICEYWDQVAQIWRIGDPLAVVRRRRRDGWDRTSGCDSASARCPPSARSPLFVVEKSQTFGGAASRAIALRRPSSARRTANWE